MSRALKLVLMTQPIAQHSPHDGHFTKHSISICNGKGQGVVLRKGGEVVVIKPRVFSTGRRLSKVWFSPLGSVESY